jgi:short-subunit dehydrogenase
MPKTALITGASSGIGLYLAHEFARCGHPVVITAPVESELQHIRETFKTNYNITARVIAKDLEQPNAAQEIFDELESASVEVDILVNNAGHGFHGNWWELPIDKDISMLRLNVEAVLRLTKLFLPPTLRRNRGRILNTASVAGFEPSPLLATYFATKAFVLSWSEALATELDKTAISVPALCPGVTDTDFFEKADAENIRGCQSIEPTSYQTSLSVPSLRMIPSANTSNVRAVVLAKTISDLPTWHSHSIKVTSLPVCGFHIGCSYEAKRMFPGT